MEEQQLKRIYEDKKMSNETSFKSDIKVQNDTFYQKVSQGDDADDKMKPIIKEDRTNMVIKCTKIFLADPVETLLNLTLKEEILWITKETFQNVGYVSQFFTGKRTAQIKISVKLLYTSQSCTWKKHNNNLQARPSAQLL